MQLGGFAWNLYETIIPYSVCVYVKKKLLLAIGRV